MQNTQFILTLLFKTYTFYTSFFVGSQILFHFFTEGSISERKKSRPGEQVPNFLNIRLYYGERQTKLKLL